MDQPGLEATSKCFGLLGGLWPGAWLDFCVCPQRRCLRKAPSPKEHEKLGPLRELLIASALMLLNNEQTYSRMAAQHVIHLGRLGLLVLEEFPCTFSATDNAS